MHEWLLASPHRTTDPNEVLAPPSAARPRPRPPTTPEPHLISAFARRLPTTGGLLLRAALRLVRHRHRHLRDAREAQSQVCRLHHPMTSLPHPLTPAPLPRYRIARAAAMYVDALAHIRARYPFWNASGGRDHVWVFGCDLARSAPHHHLPAHLRRISSRTSGRYDEGACFAPVELRPSVLISHWGNTMSKHNRTSEERPNPRRAALHLHLFKPLPPLDRCRVHHHVRRGPLGPPIRPLVAAAAGLAAR
jgi:hypothetical protein